MWGRDDRYEDERDAPTGFLDSTAPRQVPGAEAEPDGQWLRDEDARPHYLVNPRLPEGAPLDAGAGVPIDHEPDRWRQTVTTLDLTAAGETTIEGAGRAAWLSWATDTSVVVSVRLHSERNGWQRALAGWNVAGLPFERVYLRWDAQASKSIEFTTIDAPAEWFAGFAPGRAGL